MRNNDQTDDKEIISEPQTIGVFNSEFAQVEPEELENQSKNKEILKKWLAIGIALSFLLLCLGFLKVYFFYLSPLPPLIAFLSWKVKTLTEKIEKKNPI